MTPEPDSAASCRADSYLELLTTQLNRAGRVSKRVLRVWGELRANLDQIQVLVDDLSVFDTFVLADRFESGDTSVWSGFAS